MFLQPLVYFTAAIWTLAFLAYGLYAAFRPAPVGLADRAVGLLASILVAGLGAGAMVAGLYLFEELF